MVKTITIKDEIYRELLRLKGEGKSFSDILAELLEGKRADPISFYGVFKDSEVWKEIEEDIQRARRGAVLR